MPTIITHGVVAVATGKAFGPEEVLRRFWFFSIFFSVIPDADVIAFSFGIPYGHFFGHRGFFHSPFFGLLLTVFIVSVFFRSVNIFSRRWWLYTVYFSLLSASHGIFDGLTDGGLGIALLSPFDDGRYFLPWRPILVAPIGAADFFSRWGMMVMKSEITWVWLPLGLMVFGSRLIRNAPRRTPMLQTCREGKASEAVRPRRTAR